MSMALALIANSWRRRLLAQPGSQAARQTGGQAASGATKDTQWANKLRGFKAVPCFVLRLDSRWGAFGSGASWPRLVPEHICVFWHTHTETQIN